MLNIKCKKKNDNIKKFIESELELLFKLTKINKRINK